MPVHAAAACLLCLLAALTFTSDETSPLPANTAAQRAAAARQIGTLGELTGTWRGIMQLRRGSAAGASAETVTGTWQFDENTTSLILKCQPGSRLQQLRITAPRQPSENLTLLLQEGQQKFPLTAEPAQSNTVAEVTPRAAWIYTTADNTAPARKLTIRRLSEIRWTLLVEERMQPGSDWRRMFELGMTRDGARIANAADGQVQCVVTGGRGTIPVQHDGKTWFVCCEGCRQAFADDPAGILESYQERLKNEKQGLSPGRN